MKLESKICLQWVSIGKRDEKEMKKKRKNDEEELREDY